MNPVEIFIRQFKDCRDTFLYGCCYWFAVILKSRFRGRIFYHPIDGHFVTQIDGSFYDIRGVLQDDEWNQELIPWDKFRDYDALQYERICRDCITQVQE